MKKNAILAIMAGLAIFAIQASLAQQPLLTGTSSAGVVGQPVWFNCDFPNMAGSSATLNYKAQSGTSFTSTAMTAVNQPPYYESTYETNINLAVSPSILEYYYSAIYDSVMTTQSPKNSDNQFPPASYKYAQFPIDPQGDMTGGSAGNWLDIRASGMTYSDTRIYCYLSNVSGTWPLGSFPTYYAYSVGFMITSGADSISYALVYANVPLIISTGLYIVNQADSSFSRIGDINTSLSGGLLHMAVNISAFAADPNWPGWPPPEGYIEPLGATLTAGLSGQSSNDFTIPSVYQPQTQYLDFGSNDAPGLFAYSVQRDSGVGLIPRITYFDQNNNLPVTKRFYFDADSFNLSSADHKYSDSSHFETALAWPGDGWHRFYFKFSDGQLTTTTSLDSFLIGNAPACQYFPGDINSDGQRIGGDVTFGVRFFKGVGGQPPDSCFLDSTGSYLYVAGDVNGNCEFRGSDITRLVAFFKGSAAISSCHFFPPPLRR
jgi:hypothetical protein